jgi:excisionase family DNA binding protein
VLSQKLSTSTLRTSKNHRRFELPMLCRTPRYTYLASLRGLIERDAEFRFPHAWEKFQAQLPSAKSANPINPFSERAEMLISIPEAASELRVSRSTIYRLAEEGAIQIVHVRGSARIPKKSVELYVESLCGGYR